MFTLFYEATFGFERLSGFIVAKDYASLKEALMQELRDLIDDVPDFPKPGVLFRDVSPLLRHEFTKAIDALSALYTPQEWTSIDVIAAIESRGFVFASALAYKHGKGITLIRKAGKMPNIAAQKSFLLEYGSATLEMQAGQGSCLLVDDVLATGGTLYAAAELCTKVGYNLKHIAVLANITSLNQFNWSGLSPRSVIDY